MSKYLIGGFSGLMAVLILGVFGLSLADHYALRSSSLAAVISAVLVDLANGDRGANSLSGLTVSPVLTQAAQAKASDMAANAYFAHVSPEGKNSWYWFGQAGYSFLYAGENLAVDFSDSVGVEQAWMNSSSHRANILSGNFTEIGIATAVGTYQGHTTTFVVQMFGAPAPANETGAVRTLASPSNPTSPALATAATTTTPVLGTNAVGLLSPAPAASWWAYLLASPKTTLKYAYYALALLLLVLLGVATEFEFKRHHLRHAAAALVLLLLMVGLFAAASLYFFSEPVLAAPAPVTSL